MNIVTRERLSASWQLSSNERHNVVQAVRWQSIARRRSWIFVFFTSNFVAAKPIVNRRSDLRHSRHPCVSIHSQIDDTLWCLSKSNAHLSRASCTRWSDFEGLYRCVEWIEQRLPLTDYIDTITSIYDPNHYDWSSDSNNVYEQCYWSDLISAEKNGADLSTDLSELNTRLSIHEISIGLAHGFYQRKCADYYSDTFFLFISLRSGTNIGKIN